MSNKKLDKAVVRCRWKLRLCPSWLPLSAHFHNKLANALYRRFKQLREFEDLEEAITCHREALDLCPPGHPARSMALNNLAITLSDSFIQRGEIKDLEEAITCRREVLDLHPPGHPNRPSSLNSLAITVFNRFKQRGQIEDLEEATTCNREALGLRPPGHPDCFMSLNNLGNTLSTRFKKWGRIEDLEEAITCRREALNLCPPGHPGRSGSLNNLAVDVFTCFNRQGDIKDLEEAITHHREALDLCPPGHPGRFIALDSLANTVATRFQQRGQIKDLEDAITCHREALDLCPPGDRNRSGSLNNLAINVSTRFRQQGQIKDLEEAIKCHREALDLRPPGHPSRSMSLNNLANAVFTRFDQQGQIQDLEEAITCNREALDLCPSGHPDCASSLNNLAVSVSTRFEHRGQIEDVEEAITCYREALDLRPPGHPDRSGSLNNLANTVSARFEQQDQIEDLGEAIKCNREALGLHPPGHPNRSGSLNNLANAVSTRFEQQGQIEDLEEAIKCNREALDLCPPGHPDRAGSLNNLANIMSTRFVQWAEIADLEEAITCNREALDLCPPGHPDRAGYLQSLASNISGRFLQLGGMEDLEEAIRHLSEATVTLPAPHPLHTSIQSYLAATYLLRHESHPQPDDCLPLAFRLFENAANHSTATSKHRFNAAQQWAQGARRCEHHSTIQAYSVSLTLLDRYLNVAPDIESRQHLLATASSIPRSLASDAASGAIAMGELETAVELLEQGRAILWSKLRGYRHPLEQLRNIDRELADRFEALSGRLERHAILGGSESTLQVPGPAVLDAKMRQYRILSEEWDDVVEKIRQIEGFTHFLRAVPFTTLRSAAAEGPVIIVNISDYRSDAIILHGAGLPVLVPLPDVSPEDIALLSARLSDSLAKRSISSIHPLLRRLWDTIVRPVRDKLATLGVANWSRIWWCPTSELCALPLHAAGPYQHGQKNLPDIYISSYTPTLSTLIRARSGIIRRNALPNLLVMGQPGENLEVGTLQNVKEEIRRIHSFGVFVDVLVAGDANRQTILPHLREHSWIHFACHGHQAPQPFHSSFELYDDEQLTLIDLIRARLPNAEFAFLSACHSAAADTGNTPDEGISLAAAVQFCGFRSVVGTLWAMADIDGPGVAEDFYKHMFRDLGSVDFRDSAKALNIATRAMRKRKGMTIDRWINFVHIGA